METVEKACLFIVEQNKVKVQRTTYLVTNLLSTEMEQSVLGTQGKVYSGSFY